MLVSMRGTYKLTSYKAIRFAHQKLFPPFNPLHQPFAY
ncbi:hypothetical protein [Bacillus phage CP-51]|uniref:Uncharacterized protein n=1 Tax=Bacillus phage CP-51 TaxID=1391188 RepID=A0A068EQF6_9CAUD|nr:hypothetical protein OZ73_gp167 [Bacillus phage CP-51]AID50602.1 hypothetical protein [Bacillus phage CP-51]